jgi:hypothetical protein
MKENIFTSLIILFFSFSLISQNLISSQSGTVETDDMIIEWTLGENFTRSIRFNSKLLTEGFLQPNKKTLSLNETTWSNAKLYPNPVQSVLYFKTTTDLSTARELTLYDSYGRVISNNLRVNGSNPIQIDVNKLPYGIYFLRITDKQSNQSGIYKIIKN